MAMKKVLSITLVLVVLATVVPAASAAAPAGVDDLRGRWDVEWFMYGHEDKPHPPLTLFINDFLQVSEDPIILLASGCMRSWETDAIMPLSMLAYYDPETGSYDWTVYSTVVPAEVEPFVIRLAGTIEVFGAGVVDDVASGIVTTDFGEGAWSGVHHDRRRTKCPSIQNGGQFFEGELYSHRDAGKGEYHDVTLFDTETVIVSSAMRVEDPYGNTYDVPFYTDIFSPNVDFVGRFRFTLGLESPPISGLPYTFTLLDALGNPIEGAVSTDTWSRCNQGAPVNLSTIIAPEGHVDLSWDTVGVIEEEFDPGHYQITIYPFHDEGNEYGAGGIAGTSDPRTWHRIPWNSFAGGDPGDPDGWDFGQALGEFADGTYAVQVWSWNNADPSVGGHGSDCAVQDSSESLLMTKQDGQLSFTGTGSISGTVTTESGDPIEGAWIDACEYTQDQFCVSVTTDSLGSYRVTMLPEGGYRVRASGDEWAAEFFDDTIYHEDAVEVLVIEGDDTGGVDFALARGGSISGTVYDSGGTPLAGIAVDTEFGGYGTCTNEFGEYTLRGIPLGTYGVAAGREFCEPHPYMEELIPDITIDANTPDVGGVDFYLQEGGSISGAVTDEAGAPIAGIWVDVCEYDPEEPACWGVPTDANGLYSIGGLPSGDYRVGVWNQPGWANVYYDGTIYHEEAARVAVIAGQQTPGIDFVLVPGGSISGTVFDVDSNPLGGIAVDTEAGGFGTCTDEFGYYELTGLPLGTHNVVAGRDFCGEHPYAEQMQEGVVTGSEGVDFHLELYVEPSPQFLNVQPDHGWAHSGGWTPESLVTISFLDYFATLAANEAGQVHFDLGGTDIAHGVDVHITDGVDFKDLHVVQASFDGADASENTAWGTGPADMWIGVGVMDEGGGEYWMDGIQVGGDGYWEVDFDDVGQSFGVVAGAWVHIFDDDGDSTIANLQIGGSISGVVYDADMIPISGIAVDTEAGGYGTCTDEFGNYELTGLPLGTYNVVAGRNFCGEHPYAEQTLVDVATNTVGNDFYLEMGRVYGQVLHAGQPLANVEVFLGIFSDPFEAHHMCTDADGLFEFTDVPTNMMYVAATGRSVSGLACENGDFVNAEGIPLVTQFWDAFWLVPSDPEFYIPFDVVIAAAIQDVTVQMDDVPVDGVPVKVFDYGVLGYPPLEDYDSIFDTGEAMITQDFTGTYGLPGGVEMRYPGYPEYHDTADLLILIRIGDPVLGHVTFGQLVETSLFVEVGGYQAGPTVEFCIVTSDVAPPQLVPCPGG
jgi:heat shock protein HslJ